MVTELKRSLVCDPWQMPPQNLGPGALSRLFLVPTTKVPVGRLLLEHMAENRV